MVHDEGSSTFFVTNFASPGQKPETKDSGSRLTPVNCRLERPGTFVRMR